MYSAQGKAHAYTPHQTSLIICDLVRFVLGENDAVRLAAIG
jgi:hypothetical protein